MTVAIEERKLWTNNCEGVLGGENDRWKIIPEGTGGDGISSAKQGVRELLFPNPTWSMDSAF